MLDGVMGQPRSDPAEFGVTRAWASQWAGGGERRETAKEGGPNLCCLWPLEFPGTGISRHFLSHFIILNSNFLFHLWATVLCAACILGESMQQAPALDSVPTSRGTRDDTGSHKLRSSPGCEDAPPELQLEARALTNSGFRTAGLNNHERVWNQGCGARPQCLFLNELA